MASLIKYVKGDVLRPIGNGYKLIIHCCNDLGLMGSGVAKALFLKWPSVKEEYVSWKQESDSSTADFLLGNIQIVKTESDISVINMIGQHGIAISGENPPIRYEAIESCLLKVKDLVRLKEFEGEMVSIHAPRFGAGLAKGNWDLIEKLIIDNLCNNDIDVIVYDLP